MTKIAVRECAPYNELLNVDQPSLTLCETYFTSMFEHARLRYQPVLG